MSLQELSTELLDFPFDERCVATEPAHPRDAARLMVIDRAAGTVEHAHVRDLSRWIGAGDALIVNETSVLRARLCMEGTEGLLLEPCADGTWRMLVRRAKRYGPGAVLALVTPHGTDTGDAIELVARDAEAWRVRIIAGCATIPITMFADSTSSTRKARAAGKRTQAQLAHRTVAATTRAAVARLVAKSPA